MMKRYITILFWLICISSSYASTTWNLQGVDYKVDTLYHAKIGPGTTQTTLSLSGTVNLRVYYSTTELDNPNVDVKILMGRKNLTSKVTVPNIPLDYSDTKNVYFVGVNSDFFSADGPIGTTVSDGTLYKSYKGTGWFSFGIDNSKKLYFGEPYTTFKMVSPNAGQVSIKAVNVARSTNELILYTSLKGTSTGTSSDGVEVGAVAVDGGLKANGTTKMRVVSGPISGVGNMTIPSDGFVLSGTGFTTSPLLNMKIGEEFEITPTIYIDNKAVANITQMSGGCPVILKSGVIQNNQGLLDHLSTRQPRTSVGVNSEGNKMVILVVDGRLSGISEGVTSKDLAAIMLCTGCSDAINFDGGGSSTFYTNKFGILNVPSDGSPRAVKDGLYLSTPQIDDNEIKEIRFTDYVAKVEQNTAYTPNIYGYNSNGALIDTNVGDITLSCDSKLGVVQAGGKSIFCTGNGIFALTAKYKDIIASIPVTVVSQGGGVEENIDKREIVIFPNHIKTGENITLRLNGSGVVKIFSLNGQLLQVLNISGNNSIESISTNNLTSGIYFIEVETPSIRMTEKIIIE